MPKYRNGFIPESELVLIERNHPATRGTAARWAALQADVLKNEDIELRITGGENAYRSFAGQQHARQAACAAGRCNDAAVPGFSSHGGSLAGRDSGAIDVSNWALLGKDKFYAYCRRNGFEPGYFDWEPWHIIDWDPYNVPAAAGGGSTPALTPDTPEPPRGNKMIEYARREDGLVVAVPEGGYVHNYTSVAEYERNRVTVDTLNGVRQENGNALLTRPPLLSHPDKTRVIVTLSSEKLNDLIFAQGATSVPPINIDQIAAVMKAAVAELDERITS